MRLRGFSRSLTWAVLIFLMATIFMPLKIASAAGRLQLTSSPLPVNLEAKPGQIVSTDIRVKNSGTESEELAVRLMKFKAYGDTGNPQLIDREPGDSYFDWVSFSRTRFVAEPGVWNSVHMSVNVPTTAAFGYYYAVAFVRASEVKPTGQRQTAFTGGNATLVLLDVNRPGAKRDIEVTRFIADHKVSEYLPVTFRVTLHNTGNTHVAPIGDIFITKGGKTVGTLSINRDQGNVLPGSYRTFTATWTDGFPVPQPKTKNGSVVKDKKGEVVYGHKWELAKFGKLRLGHFKARLVMAYDNNRTNPIEGKLSFWVIPWKIILILLIPIGLIGYSLYIIGRRLWGKGKALPRRRSRR